MAPATGFWRFMDDVHEMMFPMASLDWHKTPLINPVVPTVDGVQKDTAQTAEVPSLDESNLGEEQIPKIVNANHLIADLNNQNNELLQERTNAIKWQDTACMAIKEAKDKAKISKQDAKAAKKEGLLMAAKIQKQLDDSRTQIAVLNSSITRAGVEKNKAEAQHRGEISVAEKKIEELQTMLVSAISHGRQSIEVFEELYQMSQNMHSELVDKDQEMAAKERENQALQGRLNARSSAFADISKDAKKSREACDKMKKEKDRSEKAQRAAERTVGDLQREASRVKASNDRSMKSLQTKLAESEARVTRANTRATKAEGDAEQLRGELSNTESARQHFEKREGEWAARYAASPTHFTESSSQSTSTVADVPESETSPHVPTPTSNQTEEWRQSIRRELEEQNLTVLATERQNMQQELDKKYQTALTGDRESIYKQILGELTTDFHKELAKRKTDWQTQHDGERSQLKSQIRNELQGEFQNNLATQRTQWETEYAAVERPRLESEIRTNLQAEFRNALADQTSQLRIELVDQERPQLEAKIRADLEDKYEDELSKFKTTWEAEHPVSEAGPSSQSADSGNPIEVDEPRNDASATTIAPENDMVLDSLSRESDETHLLMQEVAAAGLNTSTAAGTVLRDLNKAKDALYEVKVELRKSDGIPDKNNLLRAVRGVHINEHYIGKLSTTSRQVLIRQASEANERLRYVKNILGSNDDVRKDAMLKYLLEPLEPLKAEDETMAETGHLDAPEYPQAGNGFGTSGFSTTINNAQYSAVPSTSPFTTVNGSASLVPEYPQISNGSSKFSQMINNARYSTVPSTSAFTTITGPANSAAPGTSPFLPPANGFGNMATSSPSAPDYKPSPFAAPQTLNGFGPPPAPTVYQAPTKGPVFNPFEACHFGNQPSTPAQNNQGSPASDGSTKTKNRSSGKFKKTFKPSLPQDEGPAPPTSASSTAGPKPTIKFGDWLNTGNGSDKDHEMGTSGSSPSLPITQDQGSVAGVGPVPAAPRRKKLVQGLRPKLVPRSKKQDTSSLIPNQTPQTNPQAQVPTTEAGSSSIPRTAFTLDPNHAFGM